MIRTRLFMPVKIRYYQEEENWVNIILPTGETIGHYPVVWLLFSDRRGKPITKELQQKKMLFDSLNTNNSLGRYPVREGRRTSLRGLISIARSSPQSFGFRTSQAPAGWEENYSNEIEALTISPPSQQDLPAYSFEGAQPIEEEAIEEAEPQREICICGDPNCGYRTNIEGRVDR